MKYGGIRNPANARRNIGRKKIVRFLGCANHVFDRQSDKLQASFFGTKAQDVSVYVCSETNYYRGRFDVFNGKTSASAEAKAKFVGPLVWGCVRVGYIIESRPELVESVGV